MDDAANLLGTFLRARRGLVGPDQAGLPPGGARRVPGLRRAEVAMLAGISVEYYLRLEQGRDRHPSPQVLQSIARVLGLDQDTTAYLLSLGADKPRRVRRARAEILPPSIGLLLPELPFPAFVEGRHLDVLAANSLAAALSPRLAAARNRLRDMFLDEAEQALFPDWERAAAALLAGFRQSVGSDIDDPRCIELVGELSLASPLFGRMWTRHDVRDRRGASLTFNHPQVGELTVHREKLLVTGTDGITLVLYHPDPASEDAAKLATLASLAAPSPTA